jgi:Flp pilus assembly protein TadG
VRWREEDGAAAAEFAVLVPFLVLILFSTIEFGLLFSKWEDYESASREGARFAAVHCAPTSPCDTTNEVWTIVKNASSDFTDTNAAMPATFTVTPSPPTDCTPGGEVTVSWVQTFTADIPLWKSYVLTRTIRGVFRCE